MLLTSCQHESCHDSIIWIPFNYCVFYIISGLIFIKNEGALADLTRPTSFGRWPWHPLIDVYSFINEKALAIVVDCEG